MSRFLHQPPLLKPEKRFALDLFWSSYFKKQYNSLISSSRRLPTVGMLSKWWLLFLFCNERYRIGFFEMHICVLLYVAVFLVLSSTYPLSDSVQKFIEGH